MHRTFTLTAAPIAAGLLLATALQAQSHEPPAPILPAETAWSAAPPTLPPGAEIAVLSGNPGTEGPFVLRLRLPSGYEVPAHTHSGDQLIIVISGMFNVGHGDNLDRSATLPLPAGGFVELPAEHPHFAWTAEETVVQIHGPGPFDIKYLHPGDDPMN